MSGCYQVAAPIHGCSNLLKDTLPPAWQLDAFASVICRKNPSGRCLCPVPLNQSLDARLSSRSFFSAPVNHQIRRRVLRSWRRVAPLQPCTYGVCLYIASSLCPVSAHAASIQWHSHFEVDNGSQPLQAPHVYASGASLSSIPRTPSPMPRQFIWGEGASPSSEHRCC